MVQNTEKQVEIASQIKEIFSKIKGIVDVDWYVEAPQDKITFAPDKEKAALNGVGTDAISQTLQTAIGGSSVGLFTMTRRKSL
jgi:multidrug efflux pump subunit AcrB